MGHKHKQHKMVRSTLLKIAREQDKDFATIKRMFTRDCDHDVTIRFWELLKQNYPNHGYTDVYHCPGCGKFDLE